MAKKQERLSKNQAKHDEAVKNYKRAKLELEQHLIKLEARTDVVLEQLVIKFSKDIEAQFYTEIN